jgi:hypothetical protein
MPERRSPERALKLEEQTAVPAYMDLLELATLNFAQGRLFGAAEYYQGFGYT